MTASQTNSLKQIKLDTTTAKQHKVLKAHLKATTTKFYACKNQNQISNKPSASHSNIKYTVPKKRPYQYGNTHIKFKRDFDTFIKGNDPIYGQN